MSSRPRLRFRPVLVLGLLAAAFALHACGHKKAPVPPPRMIPQTVLQLKVHQRGNEAVLRFPYPTTNYRGVPLSGIARVEVFQLAQDLPADAMELFEEQMREWREKRAAYQEALAARPAGADTTEAVEGEVVEGELVPDDAPSPVDPMEELAEPPTPEGSEDAEPDEVMERESGEAPDEETASDDEEATDEEDVEGEEDTGGETDAEGETDEEGEDEGAEGDEDGEEGPRSPGQAPSPVDLILVDTRRYEDDAEIVTTLEGSELDGAILGSEIVLRIPLEPPTGAGPIGYAFAVRTRSEEGLESALSPIAAASKLLYRTPPAAPEALDIEPRPDAIHLSWTAAEVPEEGFKVYRRDAQAREYTDAIGTVGGEMTEYNDYGAVLGARYIYAVTAVERDQPLFESALSVEREILYQDRFPPAAPQAVVAFPEEGQVRVLWDASTSDDVAGYIVYRREEGGSARALTEEPVDDLEFVDTTVQPGQVLLYAAVAVDGAGNRSDSSAEVRVRIP
jgi:hypothetical protein